MKKYIVLLSLSLGIVLILIQSVFFTRTASTAGSTPKPPTQKLARLSAQITVQAVGQSNPLINLRSGRDLLTSYLGSSHAQLILEQNLARPTALASADFDEDGTPDLLSGYAGPAGGILTIHRGNVDAIYPNSPEAKERKAAGTFTASPFLAPAHVFELPEAPDFLATGDFDADGHWDVATAAYASNSLYLLSGDGQGSFDSPKPRDLPGTVTALASGEINRADGLTDVAIAVAGEQGAQVLVFEGPEGALRSNPEVIRLPAPATGLVLAKLNEDYLIDLGVAAGPEVLVVEGRDRKLSLDGASQGEVTQANVTREPLPFAVTSISAGNFTGGQDEELALLAEDGTLHLLSRRQVTGIEKEAGGAARWTSELWAAGPWSGAARLISARVSTSGADDLMIADNGDDQLQIVAIVTKATGERSTSETEERRGRVAASLNVAGGSAAVLPMRLNVDALSDLVILRSNQAAPTVVASPQGPQATFTVTNTNDSGTGSLRNAIDRANVNQGADLIDFNIGLGGPQTINPLTALPTITDPITIDGTTQPGFAGTPIIELNGTGLPPGTNGLFITGGSSTVRGLVINRFGGSGDAIEFQTNGGNVVEGNFIGTDVTGTVNPGNGAFGVFINGPPNNRIGGTTVAARNLISGHSRGIFISGLTGINTTGNLVQGNFIGTDAAGTADLGNTSNGVTLSRAAVTTIGGTVAGAGNIISGNNGGIGFDSTSGTLVQGNFIGTDVTGTVDLGNSAMGVQVTTASPNNTFGGTTPAARNIVSGNTIHGFQIRQTGTNGNVVQGNFIGTQINGTSALGNGGVGVSVENFANNNVIGGAASGAGNIVAFNNDDGVDIIGGTGNAVLSNSIFSNSGLGIDLSANGVTPNDSGDGDTGSNNLQNFPVLTSVISGVNTVVQGRLNSTAQTTFTIQFFSNSACDAFGNGEGQNFLGSTSVTTNADGFGSFSAGVAASLTASQVVTATATDVNNNTSEFSACQPVVQSGFSISGRIADGAGQSLSGVTVTLSGGASSSTTTDANGNYSFGSLAAAGNYTVTPSSSIYSFNPSSYTFNNLNENRIAHFVATQTVVSITGKVTDANNAGISNVTVVLTKDGLQNATTLTNGLGDYSFVNLPAGATYGVTPAGSFTPSSQSFSSLTVNAVANFTVAPSIPPQCNTVSFGAATNFTVGTGPLSVAIGDFNGDGKNDLAVANSGPDNVSILLGTGTGSFGAATNFAVGADPFFVAIGDFNGDGKIDLAVANRDHDNVSILLGTGTGSFGAATNFTVGAFPVSVAIGDFNGDGKSDLAVANFNSGNVSILLGTGTGSFGAATNFAVGTSPDSVAIGDFNGDGKSDLAVANQNSNNVSILLGTGTGSFFAATNFTVAVPVSVAIGDFNGDGKSDLAVANLNNNVSILLGTGTGSFGAVTNFFVGTARLESVAIGDFNGDGKNDLGVTALTQSAHNVSILLGTGTGSFGAATPFAVGLNPNSVAIGDFNGDGKNDLAVANSNSANVSILLNNSATCNTQTFLSISGRLATANNNPLAEVTVTLSGPITRVTQTNVNGNYAFANLAPGGNYAVTIQSPQYVFAPSRADFFNLSSNQTANFTAAPVVVPSPLPPPNDDFTSTTRDPNKWNLGTQTQPPTAFDPQINVAQITGQLMITPLAQVSGMHYNGYVSANSFDLRGGSVSVELVQAATGGADTIFAIGFDANNFQRFMVHTPGGPTSLATTAKGRDGIERPLDTTVAQLIFQVNVGGQLTALSIPYDPVAHRYMRFRHEAPANAIVFETSPNNSDFTERHRVTLQRSVAALTAELSAGTSNPANPGPAVFDNFGLVTSTFQFSSASYTVGEGGGSILITVTRAGSTAATAAVNYATADGTALQTTKYIIATGRLTFAPGEASKTFRVLIIDNAHPEGDQNLNLLLQEPAASGLNTPGRAVLTIIDNDTTVPIANPLDAPTFFVTQHYLDFLNREPDAAGLAFWVDQITSCGSDTQCIEIRRINVSAAYFLSIEFQETGLFVIRAQRAAFGRKSETAASRFMYQEFVRDARKVGDGVIVGQTGFEQKLEDNKQAYATEVATSAAYITRFPLSQTAAEYVDALFASAMVTPPVAERDAAIAAFGGGGTAGRVAALRSVADSNSVRQAEFNAAFVLMQYYGYLRRNPTDAPDGNDNGYQFWLTKLNQFNGNFVNAEMVKAFINSGEYRHRFGP